MYSNIGHTNSESNLWLSHPYVTRNSFPYSITLMVLAKSSQRPLESVLTGVSTLLVSTPIAFFVRPSQAHHSSVSSLSPPQSLLSQIFRTGKSLLQIRTKPHFWGSTFKSGVLCVLMNSITMIMACQCLGLLCGAPFC